MKHLKYSLSTLVIICLISISAFANISTKVDNKELKLKIEKYVKTIDQPEMENVATIYTHFLVKEEGFIYSVDFMVNSDGKITILTKDSEEEYYKVDFYNAKHVEKYSIAIPTIVANPGQNI